MITLRVVVVVVLAGLACCVAKLTDNPDTPQYVLFTTELVTRLQEHLRTDLTALKTKLEQIEATVEQQCSGDPPLDVQSVQIPAFDSSFTVMQDTMQQVVTKLEGMDGKIDEALRRIDAMEGKLEEKTEPLATSSSLDKLKSDLAGMLDESLRYIENRASGMVSKAEVEEVVKKHVEGVGQAVRQVQEACESDVQLTEVLEEVREVKGNLEQVKTETQVTKDKVEQCSEQDATEEVRGVGRKVEELRGKVEGLEGGLEVQVQTLLEQMDKIFNNTQAPPPPPPPPAPTQQDPVQPCEDSTFAGTKDFSVCSSAVRFNKCHLNAVSYHCCHTCTTHGHLPEMGPWRYMTWPRKVTTLEVIRFFAP